MDLLTLLTVAIILVATAADALRDAWMHGPNKKGWWQRHAAKWVSFYVPLAWILVLVSLPWWARPAPWWAVLGLTAAIWGALAAVAWVVWRVTITLAGETWGSWLTNWRRK